MITARTQRWRQVSGPLATVAGMTILGALSGTQLPIGPGLVGLLTLLYSTLAGGLAAGLVSAAITLFFSVYFLSVPGELFRYSTENLQRLSTLLVALPVTAVLLHLLQRRRAQAEQRLTDLVQGVNAIVWEADAISWRFSFVSQHAEAILGYPVARWLQEPDFWVTHVHPEDRERAVNLFQSSTAEGRNQDFEYRMVAADGRTVWLRDVVRVVKDAAGRPKRLAGVMVDITERKRVEEKCSNIFDNAVEGIFQTAPDGRWLTANPAMARMLGYSSQEELIAGMPDIERNYVEPERRSELRQLLEERGVVRGFEYQCYRKDGSTVWLSESARAVRDACGEVLYYEGSVEDISERKRAEKALGQAHHRLEVVARATNDAIWDWDLATDQVWWNEGLQSLFGYSPAEVDPHITWWQKSIHPDDQHRVLSGIQALLSNGGRLWSSEYRFCRADGSHAWVSDRGYVLLDDQGKPARMIGALVDITERRKTEEALRESEEKFRRIVETAGEGLWIIDQHFNTVFANPQLARMFGYTVEEMTGRSVFDFMDDESRPIAAAYLECRYAGPHDFRYRRKDGSDLWAIQSVTPLVDRDGRCAGALGMILDNTERRQLEEQLRQSQKMDAIGRLAGGVAHDFNNMLTAINGYSELLLGSLRPGHPMREQVEEIRKAGERAAMLTQKLLAFSRRQELQPVVLDVSDVVADTQKLLRRLIGEHVDLRIVSESTVGLVKVDPGQIEQVLLNLALNARDAMPGGGALTVETGNVDLEEADPRCQGNIRPGPYVRLALSDTGCGMNPETLSHIFEPFFTTKERGKGIGLGLSIVHGIVEQSGGHIAVASEPRRGTTFTIYLPRVDGKAQEAPPRRSASAPRGSETVLVVEDEAAVRSLARRVLETIGYTVLEAPDGPEALVVSQQHAGPIHLLVSDVVMPGMNGYDLAERLAPLRPQMKVLHISGHTGAERAQEPPSARNAFLHKPFTPGALARMVRQLLDRPVA